MHLKQLIEFLEFMPPESVARPGFGTPDSYRGYYEQVAFEPEEEATAGRMLEQAKSALGQTFQGYKGGDYTMHEYSDCWVASYGSSAGSALSLPLLKAMFGQKFTAEDLLK